jgi:hypothetical protein
VVRRFGAGVSVASEGSAALSAVASPLAVEAAAFVRERVVEGLRVVERFAVVDVAAVGASPSAVAVPVAALRRVRRAAGLASVVAGASSDPLSTAAVAASAPVRGLDPPGVAADSGAAAPAS